MRAKASDPGWPSPFHAVLTVVGLAAVIPGVAAAHVRYVTDEAGEDIALTTFLREVLSEPLNAGLVIGGGFVLTVTILGYLYVRPGRIEVAVARETLREYTDLVPWLLRLAIGLPLVGAGFEGFYFTMEVPIAFRLFQVALGFMLVFGLATRLAATIGLLAYLFGLLVTTDLLLASEFVGGFLALIVLGSGRPSADQVLGRIVSVQRTRIRAVAIVQRPIRWLEQTARPHQAFAPTLVRLGLGLNFLFLGAVEKLANAGRAELVVEQYNLTAVLPLDPWMWILGVGLTEVLLGVFFLVGAFVRASAGVALFMFSLTLFALADDPVLAHVSLFGLVSALLITGSGPVAIDNWLAGRYPEIETTVEGE